jgi:outer membrane protein assembly factor BamB/ribosomal protein L40E
MPEEEYLCPSCGASINIETKKCENCGMEFEEEYECPKCSATISASDEICKKCGTKFTKEVEAEKPPAPADIPKPPKKATTEDEIKTEPFTIEFVRKDIFEGYEEWKELTPEEQKRVAEERKKLIPKIDEIIRKGEKTEKIWDYELIHKVTALRMCSGGRNIVVAAEKRVYFLNEKGNLITKFEAEEPITCIGVANSGQYVIVGSEDKHAYLLDDKGNLLWKRKTHGTVDAVCVSTTGNAVVSSSLNIYYFDKSGKVLWGFKRGDEIRCVAISGSGKYAAAGVENDIYLFDDKGKILWQYRTGDMVVKTASIITKIAISATGDSILASSNDNHIYLLNKGMLILWEHESKTPIDDIALSGQGDCIALATDGDIVFFSNTGRILWRYEGNHFKHVAISGSSEYTAASQDETICLFNNMDKCNTIISLCKKGIEEAERLGTYTSRCEKLLEESRKLLEKKRYGDCYAIAREALLEIEDSKSQYNKAVHAIEDAKKIVESIEKVTDISEAKRKLEEAEKNGASKKYISARKSAEEAKLLAEQARRVNRPKIFVQFKLPDKMKTKEWYTLRVVVYNNGNADAENIFLTSSDDIVLEGTKNIESLTIGEKRELELKINLKPPTKPAFRPIFSMETLYTSKLSGEQYRTYDEKPYILIEPTVTGEKKPSALLVETSIDQKKNKIMYNVSITNNLDVVITNVSVRPYIPADIFSKKDDIPLVTLTEEISISSIKPKKTKKVSFKYIPRGVIRDVNIAGEITYYTGKSKEYSEFEIPARTISYGA